MNIAFYITGHGFGHASRCCEIISALARTVEDIKFYLRTSVPAWFFDESFSSDVDFECENAVIDVGVIQKDALRLDKRATLRRFSVFWDNINELVENEVAFLSAKKINLILSDIAPVAFLVAERLKIPSIAISNFIWSWIYSDYVKKYPEYFHLLKYLNEAYSKADLALRHPFHGDFSCFKRVEDIPIVARKSVKSREEIFLSLGIDESEKVVLMTFGGFSVKGFSLQNVSLPPPYRLLACVSSRKPLGENLDLSVPDLMSVASVVVGKPGYGIVSECIAASVPFLYTSRGDFAEYKELVAGMKLYIPALRISHRDLFAFNIQGHIEKLMSMRKPGLAADCTGASAAALKIIYFYKNFT